MKQVQRNLGFYFGSKALNYRVVGYLEVANTWRYKGPTVIPFAVIDQYGCQENHFQITPNTVEELFLAAKQAKYKPLALLASLEYGKNDEILSYASFPRHADGFKLAKRIYPNPATPVFGMVDKAGVCLSTNPADYSVLIQAKVPTQIKLAGSLQDVDIFNVEVMMSPDVAPGFFCITPENTKCIFDLCKAHSLEPVDLTSFTRTEDSFALQECNRFITAHDECRINDGDPIYIAGFSVRDYLRNAKASQAPVETNHVAHQPMDTPAVFRKPTKVSIFESVHNGPRIMNRADIQARQSV